MLKVILIDDEYYFRTSLKHAIPWEENGFSIVGDANNGRAAYVLLEEQSPDLALVDINMPQIDGLQLIEMARQAGIQCKFILLTGYDDFKYAQRAIRLGVSEYVLKPVNHEELLCSVLRLRKEIEAEKSEFARMNFLEQQNDSFLRQTFLQDLINGNLLLNNDSLTEYASDLGLVLRWNSYAAVIFECTPPQGRILIQNFLLEQCEKNVYQSEVFSDSKQRICALCEASSFEGVLSLLHAAATLLEMRGIEVSAGVGRIYTQVGEVFLSYNEACAALHNRPVCSESVVLYENMPMKKGTFQFNLQLKIRLKQAVRTHDLCALEQLLQEVFDSFRQEQLCFDSVVIHTLELLSLFSDNVSEQTLQPMHILETQYTFFDLLERLRNLDGLHTWLLDFVRNTIHTMKSAQEPQGGVAQKVTEFIANHYKDSNLSIELISQELYLNYSYLCCCFKRDKGVTINEYIGQYRIARARMLFDQNGGSVTAVSERVGFEDAGYFSKCFKKITGISPRDYMKTTTENSATFP